MDNPGNIILLVLAKFTDLNGTKWVFFLLQSAIRVTKIGHNYLVPPPDLNESASAGPRHISLETLKPKFPP